MQYGFSTGAKEAMELTSTDYADNCKQIEKEKKMQKDAGMEAPEEQSKEQQTGKPDRDEEERT